jgi:hypothetical protein
MIVMTQSIMLVSFIFCFTANSNAAMFFDSTNYNQLVTRIKTKDGKKITGDLWRVENDSISILGYGPKHGRHRETFISTYSYKDLKAINVKSYILPIFLVSLVLLALSGVLGYVVFADASTKDAGSVLILAIGVFVTGMGGLIYCFKSSFQRRRFKIVGQKASYDYFRSKLLKFKT